MFLRKSNICLLVVLISLMGCTTTLGFDMPKFEVKKSGKAKDNVVFFKLSPSHFADVAKIKNEAARYSIMIARGEIEKTEAATKLNELREKLVGNNIVDDSIYQIYYRNAKDSQNGLINTEQSKKLLIQALQDWHKRWKVMSNEEKPTNPAFTNFLMEQMNLPYLK